MASALYARHRVLMTIVPNGCLTGIRLTDHTQCKGTDVHHLSCTGVVIDFSCVRYEIE